MAAQRMQEGVNLGELLHGLIGADIEDVMVTGLCLDSRKLRRGDLFCARAGSQVHGARFIPMAVEAGAAAVLAEGDETLELPRVGIPVITTPRFSQVLGEVASRFFDRPSERIPVTGITGTNGKTSIAWLLTHALQDPEHRSGMIGTLGIGFPDDLRETVNTTPDPITVHGSLANLIAQGARRVVMEVSSHALEQERVAGVRFDQALFTNLSREHLDYHESMQTYAAAKRRLFTDYGARHRILNIDDELGYQLWQDLHSHERVYGFSLGKQAVEYVDRQVSGRVISDTLQGVSIEITSPWGEALIRSHLMGDFNASNLLASFTSLCLGGLAAGEAAQRLERCPCVPGRMERFGGKATPLVIVDYAHSPDALGSVLRTVKPHTVGKLFCVFGCGGERDRGKRAEMGRVSDQYADEIIITNDNPRGEDPERIIQDILAGIARSQYITIEPDRSAAITSAIRQAGPEDVVLVAGKGHESSQLIQGEYLPFSDRNLVRACLEAW